MNDPDFPEELRSFIQDTIPTLDAAELLLLLARDPERAYRLAEAIDAMRPTGLTEGAARNYLAHFQARGLVSTADRTHYRYAPASSGLRRLVEALTRVFNERPVTLVRLIYASKDEKIRSFADAFRLKK